MLVCLNFIIGVVNLFIYIVIAIVWPLKIDKAYPRDFMQRGRVRVLLKKEDGTLYNPAISSRKDALCYFILFYF